VLTILSPVAPALASQSELPFDGDAPEPFERQVTRTLAEGLAALEQAAREAAASGGMDAFQQAVQRGVSANLCDAVAGLAEVSPTDGLEVRVAWSRTRPQTPSAPSRVFLGSDSIPLIQEAARLFRDTAAVEDVEIQGFVTRLARGPEQDPGGVTIEGLVDGHLRRVVLTLVGATYSEAVQAHRERQRVSCAGDLVKERGGFRLENPRHFRMLHGDDAG